MQFFAHVVGKKLQFTRSLEFGLFNERQKNPTPDPFLKECCAIPVGGEENFDVVLAPFTEPKPQKKKKFPAPILGAGPGVGAFLEDV